MEKIDYKISKIDIFILAWFSFTGMFNGIFDFVLFSTMEKVVIDTLIIMIGYYSKRNKLKVRLQYIVLFSFFITNTFVFLIYFNNHNHYGVILLLKNTILTMLVIFIYFSLFLFYKDSVMDSKIIKLFRIQVIIQLLIFIIYILFNKRNGVLGRTIIQTIVLQDWNARFQGSFSEPACLGFWIGTFILIPFVLKLNERYIFCVIGVVILYFYCKAKFAMLALPIAILLSLVPGSRYKKTILPTVAIFSVFICVIALFYNIITYNFFHKFSQFIKADGSATYVTRFAFIFSAIDNICFFPIGTGIGSNYEYFQNIYTNYLPIISKINLETWELLLYKNIPSCLGSKETFSYILCNFGFIGLWIYLILCLRILHDNTKKSNRILILFIVIESLISSNIFSSNAFFCVLFSVMALNTSKKGVSYNYSKKNPKISFLFRILLQSRF